MVLVYSQCFNGRVVCNGPLESGNGSNGSSEEEAWVPNLRLIRFQAFEVKQDWREPWVTGG